MVQNMVRRFLSIIAVFILTVTVFSKYTFIVDAAETGIKGIQYTFSDDCKYVVKEAESQTNISGKTQFGEIKLDGNLTSISDMNGIQAFEVNSGIVTIRYNIDTSLNIVNDKVDKVSNASLDDNVGEGAIVVQTSLDGENWILDKYYTDLLDEDSEFDSYVYSSNNIQQANGCYFRIVVAYKTEKLVEESSFWFVDTSDYEDTRWAEVYKFYLIDKERGNAASVNTSPRTVFQDNIYRIKTEKNAGYTGQEEEDVDDPHYGWSLGEFTINGYTASDNDSDNTPVFLKNVGDQVTLWFTLNQDINKLNGNEDLSINDDDEAWDEYFGITKTYFKKGTLIIRQTDAEGAAKDPIIYTNYLEASVKTGADTKVKLFEEGDYEVALDYEILDTDGWDSVTDYRLFFKFKIRNSNCMIFPFDLTTQSELKDHGLAKNGFRLDYANSKYLDVYVEQKDISFNGTSYSEDTRGNKSAHDGSQYTDEGIYVISVYHDYNNSRTTEKTIYVGDSPIVNALAKNNITIGEVNNLLAQGYSIKDDGTLVSSTGEVVVEDNEEDLIETDDEIVSEKPEIVVEEQSEVLEQENEEPNEETVTSNKSNNSPVVICVLLGLIVAGGIGWLFKVKKGKKEDVKVQKIELEEDMFDESEKEE